MEEVAGVEQSDKLTGTQVYAIIQKEILANTLPSRPVKQAPRMLVGIISMLENLVVSELTSVYHRIEGSSRKTCHLLEVHCRLD